MFNVFLLKDHIASLEKEKKQLQRKNRHLTKQVASVKKLVVLLRKEGLVTSEKAGVMESEFSKLQFEFVNKMRNPSPDAHQSYSPEIKKFALYLYYCSTKAYEFVRKEIKLPSLRTVRRWLATTACYPGFTQEALDAIKEKRTSSDREMMVCLMVDGMSIRKQIEFDGSRYVG